MSQAPLPPAEQRDHIAFPNKPSNESSREDRGQPLPLPLPGPGVQTPDLENFPKVTDITSWGDWFGDKVRPILQLLANGATWLGKVFQAAFTQAITDVLATLLKWLILALICSAITYFLLKNYSLQPTARSIEVHSDTR